MLDGLQPAPCRSGPGSREVSPEKWNPLRDEGARLCALNPWWETRRHDASTADAAAKIVGVSLRTLFRWQKLHGEGRIRPNSRRLRHPAWSHELKRAILDIRSAPMQRTWEPGKIVIVLWGVGLQTSKATV